MIRRLVEAISGVSFNRGLALGAFVGAAIAGSTIWSRIRAARDRSPNGFETSAGSHRDES